MEDPTPRVESAVLHLTPADRQDAARQAYLDHLADGEQLTGAQLGKMFDRSGRWGIDRIAEARRGLGPDNNGNGRRDEADTPGADHPTANAELPVTPAVRRITTFAVLAVALVAAVASYDTLCVNWRGRGGLVWPGGRGA